MSRKILASLISIHMATMLAASADDMGRAFGRWQQKPGLASAFHLATCGLFLAGDVAALG